MNEIITLNAPLLLMLVVGALLGSSITVLLLAIVNVWRYR